MKKILSIFVILILAFFLGRFYEYIQTPKEPIFVSVDAQQFEEEVEDKKAIILDIRTPEEFNGGRIAGAINIDYYESNFADKLNELDKKKAYKIYCNSGNRTAKTMQIMQELGFINVTELSGGIKEWMMENLPTCVNC